MRLCICKTVVYTQGVAKNKTYNAIFHFFCNTLYILLYTSINAHYAGKSINADALLWHINSISESVKTLTFVISQDFLIVLFVKLFNIRYIYFLCMYFFITSIYTNVCTMYIYTYTPIHISVSVCECTPSNV